MGHQSLNDRITGMMATGKHTLEVPGVITTNLKSSFGQRPYQAEAFRRFAMYMSNYALHNSPAHLLFHMATGSGKTLMMAGCILYMYERGHRNFIFFVNSANIIEKTRNNFLNPNSSKYLFNNTINIGGKQVSIKEVENFQSGNAQDINIVFSTIQGLHYRLNNPSENSITYEDFDDKNIVLISDEAHHINAETKKGARPGKEETGDAVSWEGTVNKILQANTGNVLLEFTATADMANTEVAAKYADKIMFDYPLKQFRADGYSKEVKVLQADMPEMERALQSIILSQYRRKVFERNRIIAKPVILFKSRTIKDSQQFFEQFNAFMGKLTAKDLERINSKKASTAITNAFRFFAVNSITYDNLAMELKNDFSPGKCIVVNSKDESEQKQIAVNTLEDDENEYRAVFAVDKLNEGWDVLNLFDIVRLYDTRDTRSGKPGKTTMSEAQLIGRGARYFPFRLSAGQSLYMRKFDNDTDNELRICEELYYHSAYNPRYIDELNIALIDIGIKEKEADINSAPKRIKKTTNDQPGKKDKPVYCSLSAKTWQASLATGRTQTITAFTGTVSSHIEKETITCTLASLGMPILRKAMSRLQFYEFATLKDHFPVLKSASEFITSKSYLAGQKIAIEVAGKTYELSPQDKLDIAIQVLESIATSLR